MDKLDFLMLPFVYLFRTTLLIFSLAFFVLKSTCKFIGSLEQSATTWAQYISVRTCLELIYHTYWLVRYTCAVGQAAWMAITFWPKFLWSLFGPSSRGPSIWYVLFNTHAPPKKLQQDAYLERGRLHILPDRYLVFTSCVNVSGQNMHLRQSNSKMLAAALDSATAYVPITDPLRLCTLYKWVHAWLPTFAHDDLIDHVLELGAIVLVHVAYIATGLLRLLITRMLKKLRGHEVAVTKKRRRRRKRRGKFKRCKLPLIVMRAFATSSQHADTFSLDTDGMAFIMDNSATGAICNERSMFVGSLEPHKLKLVTAQGTKSHKKHVGTLRVVFTDDDGKEHTYDIPGVVYDPESPHNLLGIPFLAKFFAHENEPIDKGTRINSGAEDSVFTWDHGNYTRHFEHPASELPEMRVNEGTTYFSAFCTRLKSMLHDSVQYSFSSAFTLEPSETVQPRRDRPADDETKWYEPSSLDEKPAKQVKFAENTKPPAQTSPPKSNPKDFELGQNLVYHNGSGKFEAVVYEGADDSGLHHTIRHANGHKSVVFDSHLSFQHQMSMSNLPSTPLDYCKEVGRSLTKEEAQRLARPRTLSPLQQELMSWHHRLYHLPFNKIFQLAQRGFLPKQLLQARDAVPICIACQFGSAHRRPWRNKGKKSGSIRSKRDKQPGDGVSVDQIVSSQPGLIPQMSGFLTSKRIWGCTTFVDHVSNYVYVHLMRDFTLAETLLAKAAFEKVLAQAGREVKHYRADNGRFADAGFVEAANEKNQKLTFCGVGAHHQNGIIENRNKILTQGARTLLLHGMRMWPQMIDSMFWPFAFKAMAERINTLQIDLDGATPESILHGVDVENIPVKSFHTLFCPVYVLDSRLHNAGAAGPPKWEPRARIGVYLGHSPFHAGSVALVFNPMTGRVSPQYHVVFDDDFTTVPYMEKGVVPPHWEELYNNSSELATHENFELAETWFNAETTPQNESLTADNPVVDPFGIVPDQPTATSQNGTKTRPLATGTPRSESAATSSPHTADHEGERSPQQSKRRRRASADTASATALADPGRTGVGNDFDTKVNSTEDGGSNSLSMPTRINLRESGLRRSPRIAALREAEAQQQKAHVTYGTRAKKKMLALFTLMCFATRLEVPQHRTSPSATFTQRMVNKLEELNEHYDGTLNEMHLLSYSTELSSNEVFTYQQAMKQEDRLDFIKAMEKEIEDHESRGHWHLVHRSTVPENAKPIKAIWSFKRKRRPDGTLQKHKARLCAHGGMQTWGENYWETYSPVVSMMSVRLLLIIAKIYKLDSKAIDFVLAFPQAELDVDIWMYLPIGFQVDGETEGESDRNYLIKLDVSLYGLKQGSHNWYKKLKQGLLDRGFRISDVDPCIYMRKGMAICSYVDDCVIIGNSMDEIDEFVKSMQNGSENFILTDEGSIDKFLGIDIRHLDKNKFELSQPYLVERIVSLLGLEHNEFNAQSNSKTTPVGKPLLNKDLEGKPRKLKWKYRTAVGMLTYLQGNTRPEISMAVHQTARFCNQPMLCHEKAIMRIGRYLLHTKDRGIIYEPDLSKGLECYVDADFAGGWSSADADDADCVMSRTGFIIMYANCPIFWVSKLQTEIALSTAEAEYIALSQSLREVIPLMTLMKELHGAFPIHITKPNFVCTVHEDNQSCIKMANSDKFTPRTKHIALKYHHFKTHVKRKKIVVEYCRTEDQKADLLTKPLADDLFYRLRYMLNGW